MATIKKGTLLFLEAGEGKNGSGEELPTITIRRKDGDKHRYQDNDRDAYTGVIAKYNTSESGRRKEVLFGEDEKTKMLRTTFRSEDEAMRAAEKELKRLKRGNKSFSFHLGVGDPELISESPVIVIGFKKKIDDTKWSATRVIHSINDNGLTSQVEAEVKPEKDDNK